MAVHNLLSVSLYSPKCYEHQTLALSHSQFLSSISLSRLKNKSVLSNIEMKPFRSRKTVVFAEQSNFFRVLQTVWKVGKDGVEAGTSLVPVSVPRPVARISVAIVALTVGLFVLKSFLSAAFFALATMGLVYFIFIALNKDEGPKGSGGGSSGGGDPTSKDDTLEEARRIMEKYK